MEWADTGFLKITLTSLPTNMHSPSLLTLCFQRYNLSTKIEPGVGGVLRWDDSIARSRSGAFPSGLQNLSNYLGTHSTSAGTRGATSPAPLVMHMGQWTGAESIFGPPPYATNSSFPGQSSWEVEAKASLPLGEDGGEAFWDYLFKEQARLGLKLFKLDHTQQQVPDMNATQQSVGAVDTWLTTMANTAARYGIQKFYGGCVPSMILHSVTLPSAGECAIPSGIAMMRVACK